jgi:ribosomal-protein-alanine N-acetyltransferase
MKPLILQSLTPSLLPAAVDLDQRCLGGMWTVDSYRSEINNPNSNLLALLTHSSSQTPSQTGNASETILIGLGCLWAVLEEAHITLLAIDLPYQRQGLGQFLLTALLAQARDRHLEWATLEVRDSNQPALKLYEKFGFEFVGRRRGYYQKTGEDALIFWHKGLQRSAFATFLQARQAETLKRLEQTGWTVKVEL